MKKTTLIFFFLLAAKLSQSQVPKLMGITEQGNIHPYGELFTINGDGTDFNITCNFHATNLLWGHNNSITASNFVKANNVVYNTSSTSGENEYGFIFTANPFDTGYTDVFDFNFTYGGIPSGGLSVGNDGYLYGMTSNGGFYDTGTIYRLDPSDNYYTYMYSFNGTLGGSPLGNIIQAANKKLYGVTSTGGVNGIGILFSFDISTLTLTDLYDFSYLSNGYTPNGILVQANNGLIYGTTEYGGTYNSGVIFSFDTSGNTYSVVHNFDNPSGSLPVNGQGLMAATDGKLYGMTSWGGTNSGGVIYSLDPGNNNYHVLYSFTGATGAYPTSNLIQASDNVLYGVTSTDGKNGFGVVFSFNPSDSAYTDIFDFSHDTGRTPYGGLVEYSTTGINTLTAEKLTINFYPNPMGDAGTFSFKPNTVKEIKLFNILGQQVRDLRAISSSTSVQLQKGNLTAGIYFYSATTTNGIISNGKIVIQ